MPDSRNLILTLGKVLIAAAWADGKITHEEINSLKDLLFRLPKLSDRDWALLQLYLDSPVSRDERVKLIDELKDLLETPEDRQLVREVLNHLVKADGIVTDDEEEVVSEITMAIQSAADTGIFSKVSRLLHGPLQRRHDAVTDSYDREEHLDDFIKNKVFYRVRRRLKVGDIQLDIPEEELRKLCLAGALMARIAQVDRKVTREEFDNMVLALQDYWKISESAASFVLEVAVFEVGLGLDYYRLTRQFYESTAAEDRLNFIMILFHISLADGLASDDEIEEIKAVADSLKLSSEDFEKAKQEALG